MWYDWEWMQWATEQWWYLENKPEGSMGRKVRWRLLIRAAGSYLRSGKPQNDTSTTRDAIRLAKVWLEDDSLAIREWVVLGNDITSETAI